MQIVRQLKWPIQKSFVVSAKIFEDGTSLLECWSTDGGQALTAHSNCNWNHFVGQQFFRDGNVQYAFILLPSDASRSSRESEDSNLRELTSPGAPEGLPSIRQSGAKYMVMEGDGQESILDFLESVHQRYDHEERALIRTYRKQQREAQEKAHQMRVNPPKPKDIVIRFGRRNPKVPSLDN